MDKKVDSLMPQSIAKGMSLRVWLTVNITILALFLILIVGFVSGALSMNTAYALLDDLGQTKIHAAATQIALAEPDARADALDALFHEGGIDLFSEGTYLFLQDNDQTVAISPRDVQGITSAPRSDAANRTITIKDEQYVLFQANVPQSTQVLTAAVPVEKLRMPIGTLTSSLLQVGGVALFFCIMGAYLISTLLIHQILGIINTLSHKASQASILTAKDDEK